MPSRLESLKKKKASAVSAPKIASLKEIEDTELAMTTKAAGSSYKLLSISAIQLNPKNDYATDDTEENIAQLADDIDRNGLLHNIVVSEREDGNYVLLSGERRLRAYKLLARDPKRNSKGKYDSIMVKSIIGLDELEEMIFLDAANLQTRTISGNEKSVRYGMNRYVENLKKKYRISDTAAKGLLKRAVDPSANRSVYRNLQINSELIPGLLEMLDNGEIGKYNALDFCQLNPADQQAALEILQDAKIAAEGKGKEYETVFPEVVRKAAAAAGIANEAERRQKFEAIRAEIPGMIERIEKRAEAEKESKVVPAVAQKRAAYIKKYNKMAEEVHTLASPRKIQSLLMLEKAAGEGSILESLDKLSEEIDALRQLMRNGE